MPPMGLLANSAARCPASCCSLQIRSGVRQNSGAGWSGVIGAGFRGLQLYMFVTLTLNSLCCKTIIG